LQCTRIAHEKPRKAGDFKRECPLSKASNDSNGSGRPFALVTMGSISLMENPMKLNHAESKRPAPWNKSRLVGQKAALKLKDIWTIRIQLQLPEKVWV
jgi:hypothetical protein